MASDINLRQPEPRGTLKSIALLVRRLIAADEPAIAFLVVRLPALERTAWREGLRKAHSLERRACLAFAAAAARVLRVDDALAHDAGSDLFIAALTAPNRSGNIGIEALDARSALARISASMEGIAQLESETGWTVFSADDARSSIEDVIARALRRGVQERERYSFFSAIGHELRTPLSSIRGYLETLLDEVSIDPHAQRRFLTIAHNESLRMARLVEGMFEISLLDLQTTFASNARGLLEKAVTSAFEACAARAIGRRIEMKQDSCPAVVVAMDVDRLTLVLINLLENAIKHGNESGRIHVGYTLIESRLLQMVIDDDGPGIASAERERLFSFGERGATRATGSGIGLALVRLMLERIGGRVNVEGSPLGGARFSIVLPIAP